MAQFPGCTGVEVSLIQLTFETDSSWDSLDKVGREGENISFLYALNYYTSNNKNDNGHLIS